MWKVDVMKSVCPITLMRRNPDHGQNGLGDVLILPANTEKET